MGRLGPYISASNIPILRGLSSEPSALAVIWLSFYNEKARLTATVDFPTPPLHEDTAMMYLTF